MTNPSRPASFFERHSLLTIAALVAASSLLTDVAFTHVRRALEARGREASRQARRSTSESEPPASRPLRIQSEVFHHGLGPLWDGTNRWGSRVYPFATNSLGFIDRAPRQVPLQAAGRRIVFIGDSFTEGSGVAYADTFVGLVETALARQGVSVLDAAAVSYSPIIYLRKTRYYLARGLQFHELVVFLDISDVQDELLYRLDAQGHVVSDEERQRREDAANRRFGGEPEREPEWSTSVDRLLARHTTALSRGYRFGRSLLLAKGSQTGRRRGLWTVDPRLYEEYGREGLKRAAKHMDALHRLLSERGIRLVIAVYPWPDQIVRGDRDSQQARFWRAWAEKRGVDLLDAFPLFIDGTPAGEVLARDFIPGDIHWNESGHRRVAGLFLDYYARREAAAPGRPAGAR